jgi:hypothetical protein
MKYLNASIFILKLLIYIQELTYENSNVAMINEIKKVLTC